MPDEPSQPEMPKEPEAVSDAVRRTLQRVADIEALKERIKVQVRASELNNPPTPAVETPKSTRSWSSVNTSPVGIACAPQVAGAFERGGFSERGLINVPVLIDPRLTPARTQFFYEDDSWAARRKEQEQWEAQQARKST